MSNELVIGFTVEEIIEIRAALQNTERAILRVIHSNPNDKVYYAHELSDVQKAKDILSIGVKRNFNK